MLKKTIKVITSKHFWPIMYLAFNYFKDCKIKLHIFKMILANLMIKYSSIECDSRSTRSSNKNDIHVDSPILAHSILKLSGRCDRSQKPCFYCRHGRNAHKRVLTSNYCALCGKEKPVCSPTTGRDCFEQHLIVGRG